MPNLFVIWPFLWLFSDHKYRVIASPAPILEPWTSHWCPCTLMMHAYWTTCVPCFLFLYFYHIWLVQDQRVFLLDWLKNFIIPLRTKLFAQVCFSCVWEHFLNQIWVFNRIFRSWRSFAGKLVPLTVWVLILGQLLCASFWMNHWKRAIRYVITLFTLYRYA